MFEMSEQENDKPRFRFNLPNTLPKKGVATLRYFSTIDELFQTFNEIQAADIPINGESSTTYKERYDSTLNKFAEKIRLREIEWYGEPFPRSIQEAIDRTRYQNMDDFNEVYRRNIAPRVQEILKKSSANLETPQLKYNDLGLGIFDFNKASLGLIPLYKYYSFEKKDYVEGVLVETYKENDVFKYKLITDGSPVALVPTIINQDDKEILHKAFKEIYNGENPFEVLKKYGLKIGGNDAFTSTIKKSYVLKEKLPKPKNSVRIFVKLGESAATDWPQWKWTGYAAVGVAELLEILGYTVNIVAVVGCKNRINYKNKLESGVRFLGINLKSFDENLDKESLLYILSDPSFFRIKFFEIIIKQASQLYDNLPEGLGWPCTTSEFESIIFNEFGKRDRLFVNTKFNENTEFLYYPIGFISSEEELNKFIKDLGLDVVNKNQEARQRIYGDIYRKDNP